MTIFQKQNVFHQRMIDDYNKGLLPNPIYRKYFDWKQGKGNIRDVSRREAWTMIEAARSKLRKFYDKYPNAYDHIDTYVDDEDPWQMYKGFGDDRYIVSYLEYIDDELTNIMSTLV